MILAQSAILDLVRVVSTIPTAIESEYLFKNIAPRNVENFDRPIPADLFVEYLELKDTNRKNPFVVISVSRENPDICLVEVCNRRLPSNDQQGRNVVLRNVYRIDSLSSPLYFAYYNLCRSHKTLSDATPAMAAGLSKSIWTLKDLIGIS